MMNFNEFEGFVESNIIGALPEDYTNAEVIIGKFNKNNETLTSLVVKRPGINDTPSLYLENFYDMYTSGKDADAVLSSIAEVIVDHQFDGKLDINYYMVWDNIRDRVVPVLVPIKDNDEYLKDKVYTTFAGDLGVIYKIPVDLDVTGSITITTEFFDRIEGLSDKNVLDQCARSNILGDSIYCSMFDVLKDSFRDPYGDDYDFADMVEDMKNNPMSILSNKDKLFGAAQILNPEVMKTISDKIGNGFWILPSSVHEVIILPDNEALDKDDLTCMIKAINENELLPQDLLSDHPYRYFDGVVKAA